MKKQMKNEIVNQVTANVAEQTVAQLRKLAQQNGIKNASKFRRVDLEPMVIEAIVNAKVAELEASTQASKKANTDKRFKADKVVAEQIEVLAESIVAEKVEESELAKQNRKVLIVVMKMLHCEKWYRTYDKATMVNKITKAFAAA